MRQWTRKRAGVVITATVITVAMAAVAWAAAPGALFGGQSPTAADKLKQDPVLSQARWLFPAESGPTPVEDAPELPSLEFPPGVDQKEALQSLWVSVYQDGSLPAGTITRPPLPVGKVIALPSSEDGGIRIDLRAPWGYINRAEAVASKGAPNHAILFPSTSLPASLTPAEVERRNAAAQAAGSAIPEGAEVDVPHLDACAVLDPARPSGSCL